MPLSKFLAFILLLLVAPLFFAQTQPVELHSRAGIPFRFIVPSYNVSWGYVNRVNREFWRSEKLILVGVSDVPPGSFSCPISV